jgi:hypothetical protein
MKHYRRGDEMTAPTMAAIPEADVGPRRLPWRRMGWVTWRQHRTGLAGVAVFLGALAVCLWLAGLKLHHVFAEADAACSSAGATSACYGMSTTIIGTNGFLSNGFRQFPR